MLKYFLKLYSFKLCIYWQFSRIIFCICILPMYFFDFVLLCVCICEDYSVLLNLVVFVFWQCSFDFVFPFVCICESYSVLVSFVVYCQCSFWFCFFPCVCICDSYSILVLPSLKLRCICIFVVLILCFHLFVFVTVLNCKLRCMYFGNVVFFLFCVSPCLYLWQLFCIGKLRCMCILPMYSFFNFPRVFICDSYSVLVSFVVYCILPM